VSTCNSDPVLLARPDVVAAATLASSDPSVANNIFVGKVLMISSVPDSPIEPGGSLGLYSVDCSGCCLEPALWCG
jgi:hypothetical protein